MPSPGRVLNKLRLHPRLMVNFIYSIFINLLYCFREFFRFKLVVDFGSRISRAPGASIQIDKRLYLGGQYIGDMSTQKASLRLYRDSIFHAAGRVKLGPGVGIVVREDARLSIGDNTYVTASSVIYCSDSIEIGSNCAVAWGITIIDTDFHRIHYSDGRENEKSMPVRIGDHVWIGCNCTVLKGVTIGDHSVVGANTLVNRDIPPNSLAVGNPMKIISQDIDWQA